MITEAAPHFYWRSRLLLSLSAADFVWALAQGERGLTDDPQCRSLIRKRRGRNIVPC